MDALTTDLQQIVPPGSFEVIVGGHSTAGRKDRNDDAFVARVPSSDCERWMKGVVGCIADGISSSDKSHLASQTAVIQFTEDYYAASDLWAVSDIAAKILNGINRWFSAQGKEPQSQSSGWVTTFTGVVLKSTTAHIFHVGDCRVYVHREGRLRCLTRDHTHTLGSGEAVLTAALGADQNLRIDYIEETIQAGDLLILLSDGVHSVLEEKTLLESLGQISSPCQREQLEIAASELCTSALDCGSDDNLSALFMRVTSLPQETIDEAYQRLTQKRIPPALNVGNKIDNYQVERVLHSGTRSYVYLVRDLTDNCRYVLKAPSRNFEENLDYLEGFSHEQWVGRQFQDPSLVKVIPHDARTPFLYAVMEYVEGPTLRQWMTDNPNPTLTKVRELIGDLIRVVRVLHRAGLVHRDLKPENIILSETEGLKLIDYGTVLAPGLQELRLRNEDSIAQGSVDYIAPETLLGEQATTVSDLFSIGCITYELLTGRTPYHLDPSGLRWAKSFDGWHYRSMRYLRNDIPEWLDLTMERATTPDPAHRYHAMSEFEEDLKRPAQWIRLRQERASFLERDPVLFWKTLALILFAVVIVQMLFFP